MENIKTSKKLNSLMWFVIYSLPLLLLLITFIGYLFVFKETGSELVFEASLLESSLNDVNNVFSGFSWNIIFNTFEEVFGTLGFGVNSSICRFVIIYFTWFIQASFIHLLVDFLVFIPRLLHKFMERWS